MNLGIKADDAFEAVGSAYVVSSHFWHVVAVAYKWGIVHAAGGLAVAIAAIKRWL